MLLGAIGAAFIDGDSTMTKTPLTLRDQVDRVLGKYIALDQTADDLIDAYVLQVKQKCENVPVGIIRQCELDNYATGFCHRLALERLRGKLA
jgi:hypothetical protein